MKILFVEDNPVTSRSISKLLENKGYKVICARTLDDALETIASEKRFTHLVCDYDLDGESGLEAVTAFYKKFSNTNIMIFTGHQDFTNIPEVQEFFSSNFNFKGIKIQYKPMEQNEFFQWFNSTE